ncbi:hypothetical protein SAMN02745130_02898 [Thiothrix eikelboomii]|uniref:Uncharacterized protein n=1 Tax=Thiothrix eikelboomii TaxID=92487 RepID=A0A1T4XFT3_9GAMM|nr:hypothetical protein [Thiothrix eikelboomii]SKA87925.1 hypothetical protein SAMN02745130_02898 [Thiothrix eikelboomii]
MEIDRLQDVGNTIRLSRVAEQIAEIEGGAADILWVMRLCIDRGVRVCIKIAEPIYVWRWGNDPGFYVDLPVMGMGDYIEPMTGIAFLFSSTLETLIVDRVAKCSSLYLPNDSWDGGVEHLDIASHRHFLKQSFAEELKNKSTIPGLKRLENDMQAMIDRASDTDYLVIDTNDLYMSKKDMDRLLQLGAKEQEPASKISQSDVLKNTVQALPKDQPVDVESENIPIEKQSEQFQQDEEAGEPAAKKHKYDEWQAAVNDEYSKNNRQSHSAICARLAKSLGTSAENLRRRTTNPKNLKL